MLLKNANGQYVFPIIILEEKQLVDWQTLLDITGLPSTTMYRLLKKINYQKHTTWKNRKLYDLEFAIHFWNKMATIDLSKEL